MHADQHRVDHSRRSERLGKGDHRRLPARVFELGEPEFIADRKGDEAKRDLRERVERGHGLMADEAEARNAEPA